MRDIAIRFCHSLRIRGYYDFRFIIRVWPGRCFSTRPLKRSSVHKQARPRVDTLHGSKHANMKELRFRAADSEWRVAFAFDPQRQAVLLAAGGKSGQKQQRFYKGLVARADWRFSQYLEQLYSKGD